MSGRPTRRAVLAGASAAAAIPGVVLAASAARTFAILRDGDDIGRHRVALRREGADLQVDVDVDIVVRILGIAAYRYEMRNREVWRDGALVSVDCAVNDDGRRKTVKVRRAGGGLEVDASFYSGPAPADAATTTYFTPDFLERRTWISTDSGEVYAMQVARAGEAEIETAAGRVRCAKWRARNGADFDVELFYDQRGEWASVAFDASGARAIYRPEALDPAFAGVWAG